MTVFPTIRAEFNVTPMAPARGGYKDRGLRERLPSPTSDADRARADDRGDDPRRAALRLAVAPGQGGHPRSRR